MPLADYLRYQAGYVPREDANAQHRCFEYLEATIKQLQDEERADPDNQILKNLEQLFENLRSVTEAAEDSVRLNRANTFWRYWDKSKRQIIETREKTKDDYDIQDKVAELEEGRYTQE